MPELSDVRVLLTGDDEADLDAVRFGLPGTIEVAPGLTGAVAAMRLREFGALIADVNSVQDALALLREHDVTALAVVENDRLVGLMTERDFLALTERMLAP